MRVDLIEKLILVLVCLTVFAVGGGVIAMAIVFPGGMRSGVPDVAVQSDVTAEQWLSVWRANRDGGATPRGVITIPDAPVQVAAAPGQPVTAESQAAAVKEAGIKKSQEYFASNDLPDEDRAIPNIPWLRKVPGVSYHRPRRVSEFIYQKYQSFEDTWNTVQSGGGKFSETSDGQTAYEVTWIDPRSELASMVGLRQSDKIIAVNGQPIGRSVDAGRAMYEQLKGQKKFAVMIERDGQRMVLPFFVP